MPTTIDPTRARDVLDSLSDSNRELSRHFPGEPHGRQPVHSVYGGAHLFSHDTAKRLGARAIEAMDRYAESPAVFAETLGIALGGDLAERVYARARQKLEREAVEDFRIDFEDGFGNRPDQEEDDTAERAAREMATGLAADSLPPFIGIRIKPLSEELKARSARTVDIFMSTLLAATKNQIPPGFVVTLPKVTTADQVKALVSLLSMLEASHGLEPGSIQIELMIEGTQAILDYRGQSPLPGFLDAAGGRCTGVHFGTYDYTASCNVTAAHQTMNHPAADFAKHMMKVAFASRGVFLSDGATNIMPVGPHKGAALSPEQLEENRRVVHDAWRLSYGHIRHSLINGFYQGWDLHPAQLPIRYAACYAFFLEGFDAASQRLSNFIEKAAQAALVGDVFDDAATGQGLLNYFLRALNCGAVSLDEVTATGLTLEEIQGRSFLKILENRRG